MNCKQSIVSAVGSTMMTRETREPDALPTLYLCLSTLPYKLKK